MYVHINIEGVVVDTTEDLKYIAINPSTHIKYQTDDKNIAVGVQGTSEVHPLAACNLLEEWDSITSVVQVQSLPEDYADNKYSYIEGQFVLYPGIVPNNNYDLTQNAEKMMADIDYIAMMTDVEIPEGV